MKSILPMLLAAQLLNGNNRYHNGIKRNRNPWDEIHISKAERKGKTYEEIQELRKSKWESYNEKD